MDKVHQKDSDVQRGALHVDKKGGEKGEGREAGVSPELQTQHWGGAGGAGGVGIPATGGLGASYVTQLLLQGAMASVGLCCLSLRSSWTVVGKKEQVPSWRERGDLIQSLAAEVSCVGPAPADPQAEGCILAGPQ